MKNSERTNKQKIELITEQHLDRLESLIESIKDGSITNIEILKQLKGHKKTLNQTLELSK